MKRYENDNTSSNKFLNWRSGKAGKTANLYCIFPPSSFLEKCQPIEDKGEKVGFWEKEEEPVKYFDG